MRRLALGIVVVSLSLNVLALLVPFLRVDTVLERSSLYSLPRSVWLMWEAGMIVLAMLVAAFSIGFPFAKLVVLGGVALGLGSSAGRARWLDRVGRLGRWSMLDVFLAALLLALTNQRFFVETEPRIGLVLFTLAILLSLTAGELLEAVERGPAPAIAGAPGRAPAQELALLGLAAIGFAGALVLPFLQIADWRMRNDLYSLLGLVPALWDASPFLALALAMLVLLLPMAALVALGLATLARGRMAVVATVAAERLSRWAMLDVFALALTVFLAEGHSLVRTELRWGTLFLVIALILHWTARWALERRLAGAARAGR